MRFEHCREADLDRLRDLFLGIYAEIYRHRLEEPYFRLDAFAERLNRQAALAGWAAVVAWDGREAAGWAHGATLPTGSRWWDATVPAPPGDFTAEDGARTFAVSDVMVDERWRGQGIAKTLHTNLLADRPEERATFLVETNHPNVRAIYESWGYEQVGTRQSAPETPLFAVMTKSPLR